MSASDGRPGGVFASVRRVLGSTAGMVRNRIELFVIEFQEEKYRIIGLLLLAGTGLLLGTVALVTVTFAVILLFEGGARAVTAAVLGLLYFIAGGLCLYRLRHRLENDPKPFAETRAQLDKDSECFRTNNSNGSPKENASSSR